MIRTQSYDTYTDIWYIHRHMIRTQTYDTDSDIWYEHRHILRTQTYVWYGQTKSQTDDTHKDIHKYIIILHSTLYRLALFFRLSVHEDKIHKEDRQQ